MQLKLWVLAFALYCVTAPNVSTAATPCPTGQVRNYMLKGKCVKSSASRAGLAEFGKNACTACHSKTGSACPVDLGTGSCSYKRMAQLVKSSNNSYNNTRSVPPSILINLFTAYSAYMPGIEAPSTAEAKKMINYLSTIKQ